MTTAEAHARATETIDETRSRAGQIRVTLEGAVDHVPEVLRAPGPAPGASPGVCRMPLNAPGSASRRPRPRFRSCPTQRCGSCGSFDRPGDRAPPRRRPPRHHPRGHRASTLRRRSAGHPPGSRVRGRPARLPARRSIDEAITEREIEMNRGGGVGIIGVIVIVVVILFLVGVIRL